MTFAETLAMLRNLKAVLAVFVVGIVVTTAFVIRATESHEQTRSNVEQIQLLTDILEAQEAVQKAEKVADAARTELLRELCNARKLDLEECNHRGAP